MHHEVHESFEAQRSFAWLEHARPDSELLRAMAGAALRPGVAASLQSILEKSRLQKSEDFACSYNPEVRFMP